MNSLMTGLIKVDNITRSGLTIYDRIRTGDQQFWLTSEELSAVLNLRLKGTSFYGLAKIGRAHV